MNHLNLHLFSASFPAWGLQSHHDNSEVRPAGAGACHAVGQDALSNTAAGGAHLAEGSQVPRARGALHPGRWLAFEDVGGLWDGTGWGSLEVGCLNPLD